MQRTLTATFMIMGLLPSGFFALVSWTGTANQADVLARGFQSSAVNVGQTIDRNLFERYGDVQAFGSNNVVQDRSHWYQPVTDNPLVDALNRYVDIYDIYYLTVLVDLQGRVIAVNSRDSDGQLISTEAVWKQNFHDAPWFTKVIQEDFLVAEQSTLTGTVVDDAYFDPTVKQIYANSGLALAYSAPVRNSQGEVIAIWRNVTKFSLVEEILDEQKQTLADQGYPNATLTLLDSTGRLLVNCSSNQGIASQANREHEILQRNVTTEQQAAQLAVDGQTGYLTHDPYFDDGSLHCVGFAPLKGALGYAGLNWRVLVSAPSNEVLASISATRRLIILALTAVCLLLPVAAMWVAKLLLRPLHTIVGVIRELATSRITLSHQLPVSRGDIIGELSRYVNRLLERLVGTIQTISKNAVELGDSSRRLTSTSIRLSGNASSSQTQCTSVSSATLELSTSMQEMAEAAEHMSDRITSVATAIEQMTSTVDEIARNADQSASVAKHASDLAAGSDQRMSELGKAAAEIGKVIDVIQDIAEQTNLLALNATIESARAGEAGKGFGVVANEVKELARQTAAATLDIRKRIEAIQQTTTEAIDSIAKISNAIDQVNEASRSIAAAVEEQSSTTKDLARNVGQAAKAGDEIARAVSESAAASQAITENMFGIESVTKQTAQDSARIQHAGEDLGIVATSIAEVIAEFADDASEGVAGASNRTSTDQVSLPSSVPAELRESWQRVQGPALIDKFYARFFQADSRIAGYFLDVDMVAQKKLLQQTLSQVILYSVGDVVARKRMEVLARTHSAAGLGIPAELYTVWENSLLSALRDQDPKWNPSLEQLWRKQLEPSITKMRSSAERRVIVEEELLEV